MTSQISQFQDNGKDPDQQDQEENITEKIFCKILSLEQQSAGQAREIKSTKDGLHQVRVNKVNTKFLINTLLKGKVI